MDRKTLLAISICFLIFVGWQEFYLKPIMKDRDAYQKAQAAAAQQSGGAPAQDATRTRPTQATISEGGAAPRAAVERPLAVESMQTQLGTVRVTNASAILAEWDLSEYVLGSNQQSAGFFDRARALFSKKESSGDVAPVMGDLQAVTGHASAGLGVAFDSPTLAYLTTVRGEMVSQGSGYRWTYEDDRVSMSRTLEPVDGQPYLRLRVITKFKREPAKFAFVSVAETSPEGDAHEIDRVLQFWTGQEVERIHVSSGVEMKETRGQIKWIGAANRYFLFAVVDETGGAQALAQPLGARGGRLSLVYPVTGGQSELSLRVFFGPKKLELLRSVEPTLDHTVDLGFFTLLAYPLLQIMKWFHSITHNWGVAIILLTLLVRIAVLPLAYKSAKSMKEMAKIQPQLQRLKEKYKDDKDALNRETIALMRSGGYNPLAGCLPLLVQMPIFFALYQVLYSAIELYRAPFMLWIQDLSEMDPYFVTPLLLTALMWLQMKLTPMASADPMQVKMMQWMPVIFGVMMLTLPSGLAVYMLISTIFGIVQQKVMNKKLGLGVPALVPANAR